MSRVKVKAFVSFALIGFDKYWCLQTPGHISNKNIQPWLATAEQSTVLGRLLMLSLREARYVCNTLPKPVTGGTGGDWRGQAGRVCREIFARLCMLSHSVVSDSWPPYRLQPTCPSVHGVFPARIMERYAISFSWGSLPGWIGHKRISQKVDNSKRSLN